MIARRATGNRSTRFLELLLILGVGCLIVVTALLVRSTLVDDPPARPDQPVAAPPAVTVAGAITPSLTAQREQDMLRGTLHALARVETEESLGSGFMIRQAGDETYYVTNAHVVEGDDAPALITSDGIEHAARVVGVDAGADIAVLAVTGLAASTPLQFADVAQLETGDTLYVVGYVLGFDLLGDPTVTRGIVSGRRMLEGIDFIQTDASMNPGNSGGPLLDESGAVIGMASWGIRGIGDVEITGINFAIPADTIVEVTERLMDAQGIQSPSTVPRTSALE